MNLPPVDFMLVCSPISLRDFKLSRLNQASNLRKTLISIEDQLRQAEAEVVFADWLIEYRDTLQSAGRSAAMQRSFEFHRPFQPLRALPPGVRVEA